MKVRVQQLNPVVGDIDQNRKEILRALTLADQDEVDLLILPELVTCGYPPMDLVERPDFRDAVYRSNELIIEQTGRTGILFGSVRDNPSENGRTCFNTAILAAEGRKLDTVDKTLLPTYDVFDDLRYFEPNQEFHCMEFRGRKLGVTICEDIWYNENDIQYHNYEVNPARELAERGAEAIINISASPFTKNKPADRLAMLRSHARELGLPIFYANQVGANTELIYDGDSMVLDRHANICARTPLFEEASLDLEWDPEAAKMENMGKPVPEPIGKEERIFRGLVCGLRDYLHKTGVADSVILGLSGGVDSALVACIAREALGKDRVFAVTMPSEFSSGGSIMDSEELAGNLGIELKQIAIRNLFSSYREALEPVFGDSSFGVAEENLQTRIRGQLLMALSNKFGHMLLNTGNKSELATGYCTLYGDMSGGLSIIGDLYKTEVYALSEWLNNRYYHEQVIPRSIIEKEPSAELRPGQKDSDRLPAYDKLDEVLNRYLECQESVEMIVDAGFDRQMVEKTVQLVDYNEFKRYQAVPILKVSVKAFGTGRRWPIVQNWTGNQVGVKNRDS